ncbi:surface antigen [Rhodopseudomonas rhenobacensis]|uniref:Surface antigen n=1 Tax=Rhodopseudomonas rhenobacensis TaxID=87461 RepID=A0A7W7Z237_9BRAD|nr:RT0821/Lpp0805 family surface protein [Rhodopseudomonas rhenobacensis]MBB5046552.1 surface antigen [Rhodopseudomonas rhenobacensis]
MIRHFASTLVLLAALLLGGCDVTTGELGSGSLSRAFSAAPPANGRAAERDAAAAVTEAALGGMIGSKIGSRLDDDDRRLAYQAQLKALDDGAPGAPVPWRNPASGRYGNIVPGPAYARQGATCRGYSHTVTIAGQIEIARGTACHGPDAAWTVATS